ncbi:MAG TPA: IS110 family transposase [Solirubrobacteraceae bacterium]|nr:IS110 family transposase [Solirubrobacteraceae bacterium]
MEGRSIGLDVHRDFCEVACWQAGKVVGWPRVSARPQQLNEFAEQLGPDDRVALEATGNALAIARIIRPHVAEVVIVNTRRLAAIAEAKQKTDRHDARLLAQLLAAGMLEHSWLPDEDTRATRRRVTRRANLVVARAKCKNEVLAVLHRNLKHRPPMTDAFGVAGREWLAGQLLPADERDTIDAALRQIDFLTAEITTIERDLAQFVLSSPDARRLLTVPGVGMITAAVFLAQVGTARGDINRFTSPRRLVGYLGLDPRVRQSGNGAAHTGRISKEGAAAVRHVLVESALTAVRSPGPLRAFYQRVRARRGHQIAIVAVARKMAGLFWHLLIREQDYAYTLPTALAKKIRTIELKAGHARRRPGGNHTALNREQRRAVEQQIAQHAQAAYERTIADWQRHAQPTHTKAPTRT